MPGPYGFSLGSAFDLRVSLRRLVVFRLPARSALSALRILRPPQISILLGESYYLPDGVEALSGRTLAQLDSMPTASRDPPENCRGIATRQIFAHRPGHQRHAPFLKSDSEPTRYQRSHSRILLENLNRCRSLLNVDLEWSDWYMFVQFHLWEVCTSESWHTCRALDQCRVSSFAQLQTLASLKS